MTLASWPQRCQTAYEDVFYRWMAENDASLNATMSGLLGGEMKRLLPFVAEQLNEFRFVIRWSTHPVPSMRTC